MRSIKIVCLFLALCAAVTIGARAYRGNTSEPSAAVTQDAIYLDRRLTTLEQRIYTIESRLGQIEQQIRISRQPSSTLSTPDPEINLLRTEIEMLKIRTRELECGLLRVDERTLPATVREARKRAGTLKDPCRSSGTDAPVQLSSRP